MKRTIQFTKGFLPAAILSTVLIAAGIVGYFVMGGFNLGVDFQAGLLQEIQIAPTALDITYAGKGVASISVAQRKLDIVVSGADVEGRTYSFPFDQYSTLGDLRSGLAEVPGVAVTVDAPADIESVDLLQSAQENPRLSTDPYSLHYLLPGSEPIPLEQVRAAVASVGTVSVQVLGKPAERKFMVRVQDPGTENGFAQEVTQRLSSALDTAFGSGNVVVSSTDYVGARFSKNLTDQVAMLVSLTLLLILVYASIRFKPAFAFGAVLATMHDALIMVGFITWTRMEFNTLSIAAILTILGYSINDTIVIFDRIREHQRLNPEEDFGPLANKAITETLGRTIITTVTTMLAAFSLFIFTTGSMKDFALALIVGMVSGTYSTIFIASAFVYWWKNGEKKRKSRRLLASSKSVKSVPAASKA